MLAEILGDSYIHPLGFTRTDKSHKVRVVRTSRQVLAQGGASGSHVSHEGDVITSAYTDAQMSILDDIQTTLDDTRPCYLTITSIAA
jgi:hypothetical protein